MKNYLVFFGKMDINSNGMYDFKEDFDTLEEAIDYLINLKKEHGYDNNPDFDDFYFDHIYSMKDRDIVY